MKYFYSAIKNLFFCDINKDEYENSGDWPDDGIEVTQDIFYEYAGTPPAGKMRIVGSDGAPAWIDIPPATHEELVAQAEADRQSLLAHANAVTADWRTELALGIISDEDKEKLTEWMQYIKAVKAVGTSTAPDVSWPQSPVA